MTRSRRTSIKRLALASLCVAMVAAACSDDEGDGADTTSAGDTSPEATTGDTSGDTTGATTGDTTADTSPEATTGDTSGDTTGGTTGDTTAGSVDEECRNEALDELVTAAEAEGSVTVYSSQGNEELAALAASFEQEYPGVDVEVVRDVDSTAIARVETEIQTGSRTADFVVTAAPGWVTTKAPEGWFVAPTGPQFTCASDYDVDTYLHEGNYFNVSAVVFTPAWNTDEFPDGFDGYEGMLDPSLAGGRIGVVDPSISPVLVDFYSWLNRTYGDDYNEQLAAQEPRIYPGAGANQEALISGEIGATIYVAPVPTLEQAIADGAPVDYAVPDEAWGAKFYGTILDGAPHPNAAQLFADYMVTAAGQELIHSGATVLPDIPGALTTVDALPDIDLEGQAPDAVTAFVNEWNGLFR